MTRAHANALGARLHRYAKHCGQDNAFHLICYNKRAA
jgi:hypothetical protein